MLGLKIKDGKIDQSRLQFGEKREMKTAKQCQKSIVIVLFIVAALSVLSGIASAFDPANNEPDLKNAQEQSPDKQSLLTSDIISGLKLRNIGPAQCSGRISDIVKDPTKPSTWYVAVASGNVWKTVNNGTEWTPIFDDYGSYSIGCITIDAQNPNILWLGTGENNSQRSVGYGDGVYKSLDSGKSWKNVGLKQSEHIGKILIDPRNSDVVYVAAQGPLWASGGDRGLYKTVDGGQSWELILFISENTGVSDIAFDPRNPDIIYATSYQRRRHVWALAGGGPDSAIHKSVDAGKKWKKIVKGLPSVDLGRIGIAVSPQQPDVVYATVAAAWDESGFFRSSDGGENWVRMSDYISIDPQYYQEIFADPHQFDRIYCMDVMIRVTDDGGKTWNVVNSRFKHVDNHALLFDLNDSDYLMVGCDGGIYETWDRTKTWRYIANLPVTQFYRVGLDNDLPFYNVYGGTQDNSTIGGPSRTTNAHGIRNSDWFITVGGDGYQARVDPTNPDIIYCESQYGELVRYDRKSGERIDIQPQPGKNDPPLVWNWDTPLIISPHSPTRLYFGANILFRSDDRGDTWRAISGNLTRQIDRNKLEVMDTVWSVESVWKNVWTSFYGNLVSLDESPLQEGLIYVGTDDGLIQVTEDGGQNWRKIETFPDVPELTYVADLKASSHDVDTVYAVFNNHKRGDFKPYVFRSTDRGRTWSSISSDLPDRHVAWTIQEDPVKKDLLFIGTEFALFFTIDAGEHWIQLKGGAPTIAFRDLEIQARQTDLVCATFGRGIMILDDYSPLRYLCEDLLNKDVHLFPVKDALLYIQDAPLGSREKASQGDAFFTAPNPPFGAIFTYYLKDELKTDRQSRKERELALQKEGKPVYYPTWESLRIEDGQDSPAVLLTVKDRQGNIVRRLPGPTGSGFHRLAWDLRYTELSPIDQADNGWRESSSGILALPGTYTVELSRYVDGQFTQLGTPQTFKVVPLNRQTIPPHDREAQFKFQKQVSDLLCAVMTLKKVVRDTELRLKCIKQALLDTPQAGSLPLITRTRALERELRDIIIILNGDSTISDRFEPTAPSLSDRINRATEGFRSTTGTTTTHQRQYQIALELFTDLRARMNTLLESDLKQIEQEMENIGAPWTPGRKIPDVGSR